MQSIAPAELIADRGASRDEIVLGRERPQTFCPTLRCLTRLWASVCVSWRLSSSWRHTNQAA